MKAQRKGGRVLISLTEKEWLALRGAFKRTQYEAQSAQADEDPNKELQQDAATLYAVEAAVDAASTTRPATEGEKS